MPARENEAVRGLNAVHYSFIRVALVWKRLVIGHWYLGICGSEPPKVSGEMRRRVQADLRWTWKSSCNRLYSASKRS